MFYSIIDSTYVHVIKELCMCIHLTVCQLGVDRQKDRKTDGLLHSLVQLALLNGRTAVFQDFMQVFLVLSRDERKLNPLHARFVLYH